MLRLLSARPWLPAVTLVAAVALAFAPGLGGTPLTWDDDINVTANPHLVPLGWESLRWMFTDGDWALRYKPLSWLLWALVVEVFGTGALALKGLNLALHAANAVLLFLVMRRWAVVLLPSTRPTPATLDWGAAAAAATWALHPLRAEPIAWISGQGYPASTLFLLLALLCLGRSWGRNAAAGALFLVALLTHPAVVTAAVLFPALGYLDARREGSRRQAVARAGVAAAWVVPPALLAAGMALLVRHASTGWPTAASLTSFPPGARALQALHAAGVYLHHVLLPVDLAVYYDELAARPALPDLAAAAGLLLALALLFHRARQLPLLLGALGVTAVLAAPVLGLTENVFFPSDRYTYVPSLALSPLVLALALEAGRILPLRPGLAAGLLLSVVLGLGGTTASLASQWWDDDTFYASALEATRADHNRGFLAQRWTQTALDRGGPAAAREVLRQLAELPNCEALSLRLRATLEQVERGATAQPR